jgi:hypothetical protein
LCPALTPAGSLPFAVDTRFIASGYEGDVAAIVESATSTTCGGNRATASAMLGACHTFTYSAAPAGGANAGWVGVIWQYPANNWGASQGWAIPSGATKVSFWVRGQAGGETVAFNAGGTNFGNAPSPTAPCPDTVTASAPAKHLTTTWQHVTMAVTGGTYPGGVIDGFQILAVASAQPAPGTPVTFYIDDIEWQM